MQAELRPGLISEAAIVVDATNLATAFGSGAIEVFATPALADGMITVGTHERMIVDRERLLDRARAKYAGGR